MRPSLLWHCPVSCPGWRGHCERNCAFSLHRDGSLIAKALSGVGTVLLQSPLGLIKLFTSAPLRMRLLQCLPVPSCKAEVFRGGCISLGAHLGAPQMRKSLPL